MSHSFNQIMLGFHGRYQEDTEVDYWQVRSLLEDLFGQIKLISDFSHRASKCVSYLHSDSLTGTKMCWYSIGESISSTSFGNNFAKSESKFEFSTSLPMSSLSIQFVVSSLSIVCLLYVYVLCNFLWVCPYDCLKLSLSLSLSHP